MTPKRSSSVEAVNDVRVVKALAHPIRVAALALLEERILSPKQIADELELPLPLVSYHIRQLEQLNLIELASTTPRRGAVQHFYRAKEHPTMADLAWADVPMIVKRELVSAVLRQANSAMAAAASEGGFDREDAHASRTPLALDERGWRELSRLLVKTQERIERIRQEAEQRVAGNTETTRATVVMMLFEGPYAQFELEAEGQPRRNGRRNRAPR
jgi:DNA-binding transcriptional ArsR family regulator